jgi:hypothetical protein
MSMPKTIVGPGKSPARRCRAGCVSGASGRAVASGLAFPGLGGGSPVRGRRKGCGHSAPPHYPTFYASEVRATLLRLIIARLGRPTPFPSRSFLFGSYSRVRALDPPPASLPTALLPIAQARFLRPGPSRELDLLSEFDFRRGLEDVVVLIEGCVSCPSTGKVSEPLGPLVLGPFPIANSILPRSSLLTYYSTLQAAKTWS